MPGELLEMHAGAPIGDGGEYGLSSSLKPEVLFVAEATAHAGLDRVRRRRFVLGANADGR
jgi:hypothetical protein